MQQRENTVLFRTERCAGCYHLTYTLFENENGYGITVSEGGSTVKVEDLSRNVEDAKRVLLLLADGTVFPQNVYEILDDLLGIEVF